MSHASSPRRHPEPRLVPLCVPPVPAFEAVLPALERIWESGELTNGRYVRKLEAAARLRMPARHVVAVSSCTAGLMLALRVLDVRGEVLVPSFTFAASAHAIVWAGCEPVFVDCDPGTFCIDVADAARKITPRTGALMSVYVSGNPPRLRELEALARDAGIRLVLDAAHALGSWTEGTPAGCFGDVEVFSLSPTKTATACEGGLASARDPEVAERLRIGRNYGNPGDYDMRFVGLNARMSELHAAVGLASLEGLDANVDERNWLAARYRDRLGRLPGIRFQEVAAGDRCSYKDFAVCIDAGAFGAGRDVVQAALAQAGVDTRTYFDPPVHRQRAYRYRAPAPPLLPATEHLAGEVLDLPLYPGLSPADQDHVCDVIETCCSPRR